MSPERGSVLTFLPTFSSSRPVGLLPGPNPGSDVLDMVDVLVEGSEGLDEEVGFALSEDTALLTFPFSAVVPAALEARNKLLLGTEGEAGTQCGRDDVAALAIWVCVSVGGDYAGGSVNHC